MKNLAKLTALLLTGVMLLLLASCGAVVEPETEQQAKQRLLKEINSYRASIQLEPLEEVKELSDAEQELIEHFRAAGKTVLPKSEADEALDRWSSKTEDRDYCDSFGLGPEDEDGNYIYILSAKVPANTPEGKAELWAALKDCPAFNTSNCKSIGIAVVTINGQMYWSCSVFD